MAATKYLDYDGLLYFWGKLKAYFAAKATTLAGYGITDAKIASGTITLGSNTITPLTSASSLDASKLTGTASVNTTGKATTAGTADKVANKLTLKVKTGTTEGTNLYTYDGSAGKTLDIKQGSNITLTAAAGQLTIAATDTTYGDMTGATSSAAGAHGLVPAPNAGDQAKVLSGAGTWVVNTGDTKNTAGSTDTSSKIFLIGATSQAANPRTYSHDTAYVGTDGCLYSGGTKVLTAHQSLSNYYTKTEVDSKLTSAMHYKGSVATVADLPSSGNQTGDFYNVTATGENYAWTGSVWDATGSIVDLAAITNSEIDTVVAS